MELTFGFFAKFTPIVRRAFAEGGFLTGVALSPILAGIGIAQL